MKRDRPVSAQMADAGRVHDMVMVPRHAMLLNEEGDRIGGAGVAPIVVVGFEWEGGLVTVVGRGGD